jgi:tripartite-type tricarboxylate transporter receptor subunit TctC
MSRPEFTGALLAVTAMLCAGAASGQAYPSKPVRIMSPGAGGAADLTVRLISAGMGSNNFGQQVITENRPTTLSIDLAAKAAPDGYTLLAYGSPLWLTQFMRKNPTFNHERDFRPIIHASNALFLLFVHPSLPVTTVKELIALAKKRPGELNYSSAASGATTHLAAELFKAKTGVNIQRIAYKGGSGAITALLTGEVQIAFGTISTGMPLVKSGRLRVLAVAALQPSPLAPGVPTLAASGVPGFETNLITGIFAPTGTPAPIIERLNQEIGRALNRDDIKERLFTGGLEPIGGGPDQLVAAMKAEITTLGKLIVDLGIRDD